MYVSTQNDIMQNPSASPPQAPELYYDRVAYAGWNFDLHNPKGMFDTSHPPYSSYRTPYMFSTPLRSLISKDARNLFLAGRLASFSHVVYGSQRVMKTCSTMGQAVGKRALTVAMEEIILLGHCSIPKLNCTPQPLLHLLFHYFFFVLFFTLPSF
eukprot:m.216110 g.216110  ORF g.216110 m.216110 type:complete len:155 (+) comp16981_c1_seq9:1498-1962(+)